MQRLASPVLLLALALAACSSTPEKVNGSGADIDHPVETTPPSGTEGGSPPRDTVRPTAPGTDSAADWKLHRFEDYGLELRVPPEYVQLPPGGQPRPAPVHRLWFGEPLEEGSPLAGRTPPPFAVDIYSNPDGLSLEDWLETAGIETRPGQQTLSSTEIAGRRGLLWSSAAQMAPNEFYYVAAEPYIYRFTPLGRYGDQILSTVRLSPGG